MPDLLDPQAAERSFFAALLAAQVDSLDQILADDFVMIEVMGGAEVTKPVFLEVLQSGQLKFDSIEARDSRVRLYQTTAVITGRTQMSGQSGGAPFSAASRYTHVYVKQQGDWRMVSAQGTPIADEQDF